MQQTPLSASQSPPGLARQPPRIYYRIAVTLNTPFQALRLRNARNKPFHVLRLNPLMEGLPRATHVHLILVRVRHVAIHQPFARDGREIHVAKE
jgi:hypothetical protein